jgi:hypothetical protein
VALTGAPSEHWAFIASSADASQLLAIGDDGFHNVIYTSTDSGATWTRNNGPNANLGNAAASSADGSKLVTVDNGAVYTSQTTPRPLLTLTPSGANALLSWTVPSLDFTLQQNSDLTTTNWTDVPTAPVLNLTNLRNQVMVSPTNNAGLFRLKH